MTMALVAIAGEARTDLLEPWPIKIVLDYVLQSRQLPGWIIVVIGWIGEGKLAILSFALLAVAAIPVIGAASSYLGEISHCRPRPMGHARPAPHGLSPHSSLVEILETESAVRDLPRARHAQGFKGKIEFDKVSFGYIPSN